MAKDDKISERTNAGIGVDCTPEQIEAARKRLRQRLTAIIRETDYHAEPGSVAGYASDLRALEHLTPEKETT